MGKFLIENILIKDIIINTLKSLYFIFSPTNNLYFIIPQKYNNMLISQNQLRFYYIIANI